MPRRIASLGPKITMIGLFQKINTRGRTDKTRNLKKMPNLFLLEPFDVVYTQIIYSYLIFSLLKCPILALKLRFLRFLLYLVVFTNKTDNW